MRLRSLCVLGLLTIALSVPSILVPLYQYPIDGSWTELLASIKQHPSVQFAIIVNPQSGPGAEALPDASYIKAISEINSQPNVIVVGYVHVTYANRDLTEVIGDVNKYRNWASYTASNISVQGIFFDESPAANNPTQIDFMKNVTTTARSLFPSGMVITNQGVVPVNSTYFDIADFVVIFEEAYQTLSSLSQKQGREAISPTLRLKSSVIIHTTPTDNTTINSTVSQFISYGVGQMYLTDRNLSSNPYLTLGQTWSQFTSDFDRLTDPVVIDGSSSTTTTTTSTTDTQAPQTTSGSVSLLSSVLLPFLVLLHL